MESSSARTAVSRSASSSPAAAPSGACPKEASRRARPSPEPALREIAEETGLSEWSSRKLGTIDYWFYSRDQGGRIHKTVHYYLVRATGGDTSRHDHEVSDASGSGCGRH